MSGLPPEIVHFRTTLRSAKLITDIVPSSRLEQYSTLESRLGYRPWAPRPVGIKSIETKEFIQLPDEIDFMLA